jgi:hypothetical protein
VARKVRELAPEAVDFLGATVRDDQVKRGDRIKAAGILVKESLASHESNHDKDLADMTADELRAFLETAETELASRARLVSPPADTPDSEEPLDIFS